VGNTGFRQAETPSTSSPRRPAFVLGITGLILGFVGLARFNRREATNGGVQLKLTQTSPAKPAGPATSFGDGTYEVGVDVVAGRYKTQGPTDDLFKNCYWQRTKDDSGQFRSIIANGNTQGPGSVTIKAGEFFQTSGGCNWAKQ